VAVPSVTVVRPAAGALSLTHRTVPHRRGAEGRVAPLRADRFCS